MKVLIAISMLITLTLLFALCCVPAPAAGAGSVSIEVAVGPCISIASDGTVRSNVSAFTFTDAAYLTVMAR